MNRRQEGGAFLDGHYAGSGEHGGRRSGGRGRCDLHDRRAYFRALEGRHLEQVRRNEKKQNSGCGIANNAEGLDKKDIPDTGPAVRSFPSPLPGQRLSHGGDRAILAPRGRGRAVPERKHVREVAVALVEDAARLACRDVAGDIR